MARKKQRVIQHIMEDESYRIIENALPNEWVIREFNRPDYGVDLVVELFEKVSSGIFETLGEFLYIQVKSIKEVNSVNENVYSVQNVAKGNWIEDKSEFSEISVEKFSIDTNSMFTVQSIGGSVAVLLFLVDLKNEDVYFLCLNDYLDKVLLPKNPTYIEQKTITLSIPLLNNLADIRIGRTAMEFYGKRAKLLSAFSKFAYQKNVIFHLLNSNNLLVNFENVEYYLDQKVLDEIKIQVLFFVRQIENLEIWKFENWEPLAWSRKEILQMKDMLQGNTDNRILIDAIVSTWRRLVNLNNMYEELTREWFLPKYLATLTSYP